MGKVIINEHNATQTASKNSSSDQPPQSKISRFNQPAQNVGSKMSNKSKTAAPSKIVVNGAKSDEQQSDKTAKAKPVARMNGKDIFGLPAGEKGAAKNQNQKIITQARIVERTQVRAADVNKTGKNINGTMGTAKGEAKKVNGKFDPELALLANRAATAERVQIDAAHAGKSMSGMIGGSVRRSGTTQAGMAGAGAANWRRNSAMTSAANTMPKEEDLRFTKFKSVLIGVGVAVVVAVIGFAAIGIFGNSKSMCTVLFESNGGSKVVGTEIVCGRTVKRPDDPTKEGFSFEGWSFEGEDFDFTNTPLYKNATLVARWKADENTEIVKVSFDTNGGSAMSEIEIAKGKQLNPNSLSTPSRPGYVFEDWYLGDQPYDFDQLVEADITLRAEWSKQQANTNNNGNAGNNNNNASEPAPVKAVSIEAAGDLTLEIGKSTTVNVNVLPSAANYSLVANSSDTNVVECSVGAKTAITCTAKAAGSATIQVRDNNSGVSTRFKVTVPANDLPPVNPGDDNPPISDPGGNTGGNTGGGNSGNDGDNTGGSTGDNSGNTGGSAGEGGDGSGSGDNSGNEGDNTGGSTGDNGDNTGSNTGGDAGSGSN